MGNLFSTSTEKAKEPPSTTRPKTADPTTSGSTRGPPARGRTADRTSTSTRPTTAPVERTAIDLSGPSRSESTFLKTNLQRKKDTSLIVAAIDFGTTFSGYAYSFRNAPYEILTHFWSDGKVRTTTAVLLDKHKKLHLFGTEARKKFLGLCDNGVQHEWYYFEHFKMKLFSRDEQIKRDVMLIDAQGKELLAIDVFSAAIEYIVSHLLNTVNAKEDVNFTANDIHWVVTVPAIWSDSSKQFMREAANKACVDGEQLTVALEPEAASLFCRRKELSGLVLKNGTQYLVMDLGGGTADIVAHEISSDGSLKEIHQATGGAYGGKCVDNNFLSVLTRLFGANVIKKFRDTNVREYCDLIYDFELKKIMFDGSKPMIMKFPSALNQLFEKEVEITISQQLVHSPLKGRIEFRSDKVVIDQELAKEVFDSAVNQIVKQTEELLEMLPRVEHLILVGGFSESPYLSSVMTKKFRNLILSPKEPSLAVLKGAVIYGHDTKAVTKRVCKYTYGIARLMRFKRWHNPQYKVTLGNTEYCENLFNKHIEIGQSVRMNEEPKWKDYYPPQSHIKQAVLEVYASTDKNPTYVTEESCRFVGLVRIDLPDFTTDRNWRIDVGLRFGGTELIVEAHEVKTKSVFKAAIDFLG